MLLLNGYCFIILFTAASSVPLKCFPNHANAENAVQDLKAVVFFFFLPCFMIKLITVRLTFLAHSVRMRPNFEGLPWFECDGLVEDELLIRFC